MKYDKKKILELYSEEKTKTEIAKQYAKQEGFKYNDTVRRKVSEIINALGETSTTDYIHWENDDTSDLNSLTIPGEYVVLGGEDAGNGPEEESGSFSMPSAWDNGLDRFLSIEEYCDKYNLDYDSLERYNLVAHNAGHMIFNTRFKPTLKEVTGITEEYIEETIKKYIEPKYISIKRKSVDYDGFFDRLAYTDVHIGMDVNANGNALYDGKWDRDELFSRLNVMVHHVAKYKRGDILVIDDLGDFLDGFNGETTRKGHGLPQNMNNREVFDTGIEFKIQLVERLSTMYDKIICNNISNDNHSGDFGYFVNTAVKHILESRDSDQFEVNNYTRFINNYSIGKHTFVISHGKDSEALKFGFKPQLDPKQSEKIDQYCKEHKLYNGNYIEFSKGDSHQSILDETTSNDFDYYNYPAFSPPSNWIKTNFKKTKSGFRFFNIDRNSQIKIHIPYYFEQ